MSDDENEPREVSDSKEQGNGTRLSSAFTLLVSPDVRIERDFAALLLDT